MILLSGIAPTNNHITILISNSTWGIRYKINCLFLPVYWRPFCMENLFAFRYSDMTNNSCTLLSKVDNSVCTPLYLCAWIKYSWKGILYWYYISTQNRGISFTQYESKRKAAMSHYHLSKIKTGLRQCSISIS